jgi:hypothetical protein
LGRTGCIRVNGLKIDLRLNFRDWELLNLLMVEFIKDLLKMDFFMGKEE